MEGLSKTPDEIKKGLDDIFVIYRSPCSNFVSEALQKVTANIVKEALAYIQHLEREKDALLKDLRATDPCDNCKHCETAWECDGDCSFCYHSETCQCRECDDDSHWEWAGIKEDNP